MTLRTITPADLYQKITSQEKVVLLDVRAEEKYNDYHIEGTNVESLNVIKSEIFNLDEIKHEGIQSLPKAQEIVVTCTTGNSASKCANILSSQNYDVLVLEGGITAWKEYLQSK